MADPRLDDRPQTANRPLSIFHGLKLLFCADRCQGQPHTHTPREPAPRSYRRRTSMRSSPRLTVCVNVVYSHILVICVVTTVTAKEVRMLYGKIGEKDGSDAVDVAALLRHPGLHVHPLILCVCGVCDVNTMSTTTTTTSTSSSSSSSSSFTHSSFINPNIGTTAKRLDRSRGQQAVAGRSRMSCRFSPSYHHAARRRRRPTVR